MRFILSICIVMILWYNGIIPCTIMKVTKNGTTLVGNNEDGTDPTTYLWFIPPSKGKYGRVYFTLSDKWPQGGMNDQGLFYDGTAGPWKEILKSSDKPEYWGNLSEKMLEECATVPEAIALLKKYNLSYFRNGQMLLADKFGNSAIVEGDTIIYTNNNYQIATNFYHSNPSMGGFPCYRYDITEVMIRNIPELSMDGVKSILQAVHLEGYSFTQYSTVHDLANLTIHYYKDSDFSNYVKIDLKKELLKSEYWIETKEFFQNNEPIVAVYEESYFSNTLKSFYEDSNKKCLVELSNGMLNGLCEGYYQNGQIAWYANFLNGKILGTLKNWNELSKPVRSYEFVNDNQTNIIDYFPDGNMLLKVTLNKVGIDGITPASIITYNENGSLSYSGTFQNGLLYLYNNNEPFSGRLFTHYKNGGIYSLTEYKDGKLDGEVKRWNMKGEVVQIDEYDAGILRHVKRF